MYYVNLKIDICNVGSHTYLIPFNMYYVVPAENKQDKLGTSVTLPM